MLALFFFICASLCVFPLFFGLWKFIFPILCFVAAAIFLYEKFEQLDKKGINLNELKYKAAKFSDQMFGTDRPAHLPLKKLSEESAELAECLIEGKIDPLDEYADCFLVLIDSFRKYYGTDVDMQTLIDACSKKLDVNTKREWKYNPETDTFNHVKNK